MICDYQNDILEATWGFSTWGFPHGGFYSMEQLCFELNFNFREIYFFSPKYAVGAIQKRIKDPRPLVSKYALVVRKIIKCLMSQFGVTGGQQVNKVETHPHIVNQIPKLLTLKLCFHAVCSYQTGTSPTERSFYSVLLSLPFYGSVCVCVTVLFVWVGFQFVGKEEEGSKGSDYFLHFFK